MRIADLLDELKGRVSPEERAMLETGEGIVANEHNRSTVLEMLKLEVAPKGEVDIEQARRLERMLEEYLATYLADEPRAWKWIIIASVYLAFVARRPMHPMQAAGVTMREEDGRVVYECPVKTPGDDNVCAYCVCVRAGGEAL
jgi:uncharacterized protein (UPF0305 family)